MQTETPLISKQLIDLLRCPETGSVLEISEDQTALVNENQGIAYQIIDGVVVCCGRPINKVN